MPAEIGHELAELACGRQPRFGRASHRPSKPTLLEEFDQATDAIVAGRDAIDALSEALLSAARDRFPDEWTKAAPQPVTLSSWVGYDTDGRTDVNWWDTLRLRLQMKAMQLERVAGQVAGIGPPRRSHARLKRALKTVDAQCAACPTGETVEPGVVAGFAKALVEGREAALVVGLRTAMPLFDEAIAAAHDHERMALCVARAGLVSHGLALAHTQFRLNASQLHNALRQLAGSRTASATPPAAARMLAGDQRARSTGWSRRRSISAR